MTGGDGEDKNSFGLEVGTKAVNATEVTVDVYKKFFMLRGAIIKKKNGKIWEKFPNRLDPPPIGNFRLFEFQTFLKIGSNSDIFDFPTFLIKVILQNNCKIIEIGKFLKN